MRLTELLLISLWYKPRCQCASTAAIPMIMVSDTNIIWSALRLLSEVPQSISLITEPTAAAPAPRISSGSVPGNKPSGRQQWQEPHTSDCPCCQGSASGHYRTDLLSCCPQTAFLRVCLFPGCDRSLAVLAVWMECGKRPVIMV